MYLDNAATTNISTEVLEEMMPYLTSEYGNPNSIYSIGLRASEAIEKARSQVAEMIGCLPKNILFTSGGSESNSMVFNGLEDYFFGDTVVISSAEHESVMNAADGFCRRAYAKEILLPLYSGGEQRGTVDVSELLNNHTRDVGLVSIMSANNELGTINDLRPVANWCKTHNVLFHTDAVQMVEGFPNVDDLGCDFMSLSGHKIHAPKGVGALYVRDKSVLRPTIYGSSSQEFGKRGGTANVAAIVGFGKACEIEKRNMDDGLTKNGASTCKRFVEHLTQNLAKLGLGNVVSPNVPINSHIANLQIRGVSAETLVLLSSEHNIYISAGSACNSREDTPSHVLMALGLTTNEARQSIRISFDVLQQWTPEVERDAYELAQCITTLYNWK